MQFIWNFICKCAVKVLALFQNRFNFGNDFQLDKPC